MKYVVECKECCWRFTSPYEHRCVEKADEHTEQTGHEVGEIEHDYR